MYILQIFLQSLRVYVQLLRGEWVTQFLKPRHKNYQLRLCIISYTFRWGDLRDTDHCAWRGG